MAPQPCPEGTPELSRVAQAPGHPPKYGYVPEGRRKTARNPRAPRSTHRRPHEALLQPTSPGRKIKPEAQRFRPRGDHALIIENRARKLAQRTAQQGCGDSSPDRLAQTLRETGCEIPLGHRVPRRDVERAVDRLCF